ncbi:unnamed protein product [Prorocentrum cordatum]|uniref:Uncharacterized protein n=1 Tax=Prorocentrum cordatum TaxID=2364126 RepID=A0ABN9Q232_9DINO|nr:unnamed protein product [Polarella glacialis]
MFCVQFPSRLDAVAKLGTAPSKKQTTTRGRAARCDRFHGCQVLGRGAAEDPQKGKESAGLPVRGDSDRGAGTSRAPEKIMHRGQVAGVLPQLWHVPRLPKRPSVNSMPKTKNNMHVLQRQRAGHVRPGRAGARSSKENHMRT